MTSPSLPLAGVTVIELGTVIAGPLCGSLLADFGAEVIKVEHPRGGDPGRQLGPKVDDVPLWWGVGARDKLCIALDLKSDTDKARFLDLITRADILVENNRPGALDRMGLGWQELRRVNPQLIMLSISGFGQTGPMSGTPGFGKIAEGMSGVVALTGDPEEMPLHVGFSLADASASLFGLSGIMAALWSRDEKGTGGVHIDLALYEPLLRMLELQAALCADGVPAVRRGTNDPYGWGAADGERRFVVLTSADGVEVSILIDSESTVRIAKLTGGEGMEALARWVAARNCEVVATEFRAAGVEAARIHHGTSIARDPYFIGRGDVEAAELTSGRPVSVPGHLLRALAQQPLRSFRNTEVGEDQAHVFEKKLG